MGFLAKIKRYYYQNSINKASTLLSKAPREMINIDEAKSIGIIFNATKGDNTVTLSKFVDKLKALNKDVTILGYIANNEKGNNDPIFFNKTNVNWANIPSGEKIYNFQKNDFDILIVALTAENLPLEYLAATSKAKFRVGSFSENKTNYYELMINTDQNHQLDYLLNQIFHFLNVINKK